MTPSLEAKRKFIKSLKGKGFKVKTDTGYSPIKYCHKTIEYNTFELKTTRHSLKCADTHIVFYSNVNNDVLDEVFVKDLKVGDVISTIDGYDIVVSVTDLNLKSNMYDLELDDTNHRYYTSDILSHNSTTARGYILWYSLFNQDKVVAILANKLNLAQEQLQQLRDSYINLPYWMQPGVKQWNKRGIQFSHGTRVVCAATSPDGIRGMSINLLYLDEFAFIKPHLADEFIASVFPTISSGKTTQVIITSCVTKDTYVYTDKGIEQVGDFINTSNDCGGYEVPEYKVLGMKDNFNSGILMHNDGRKETRIISSPYSSLECSLEHKFWACKNGEYGIYRARELTVGDFISIKYGMNCWGNDIIDYKEGMLRPNQHSMGDIYELTPDIAYIIGLYISEGCAKYQFKKGRKNGTSFVITCGDDISEHLNRCGLKYKCGDGIHYVIYSTSFVKLLIHLGFDITRKAPNKIIPKRLMQLSKETTAAMLQGIFDGDGYATRDKYRVGILLSSKELIIQLRTILLNFGILSTYTEGVSRPTNRVKVHSNKYVLEIAQWDSVKRYFDEIGFRFHRKQCVIDGFTKSTHTGNNIDVVPNSNILLKKWKRDTGIKYRDLKLPNVHNVTKHISRKTLLKFKEQVKSIYNISNSIFDEVSDNVIWAPITSIKTGENYVYDFSLDTIPDDDWCHSVIYNGIVGFQTPNGLNHFFRMWDEATDDPKHGNGYLRNEIPWNAVPGRDEAWARDERNKIGEIRFNQEYKCIGYNEYVYLRNKTTGEIETVSIGDLYERLKM